MAKTPMWPTRPTNRNNSRHVMFCSVVFSRCTHDDDSVVPNQGQCTDEEGVVVAADVNAPGRGMDGWMGGGVD